METSYNEDSVFNMGLATIYRLHECISQYEEGMRIKDPNKMFDEVKIMHAELEAEMEDDEKTENNKCIKAINKSLPAYNLKYKNLQRVLSKYPNKRINISLPNEAFGDVAKWFFHLKRIMKRLGLHMPKKDFDPAGDFGKSN